jgi:hypothetical protein
VQRRDPVEPCVSLVEASTLTNPFVLRLEFPLRNELTLDARHFSQLLYRCYTASPIIVDAGLLKWAYTGGASQCMMLESNVQSIIASCFGNLYCAAYTACG